MGLVWEGGMRHRGEREGVREGLTEGKRGRDRVRVRSGEQRKRRGWMEEGGREGWERLRGEGGRGGERVGGTEGWGGW